MDGIARALRDPAAYGTSGPVEVRETHISWVFLTGDRAYKLKKPVRLSFVDYGTRERRRALCFEEVRLNRRLAPAVYLGVRGVAERRGRAVLTAPDDPAAVEHLVEMRRFDERATLAARLDAGAPVGPADVAAIAARVAAFHASADPRPLGDWPARLGAALRDSLDATGAEALGRFADAYLRAQRGLLEARGPLAVDGHADLRAEHVVLEDPLQVVDCVEFDPGLRARDPASDLAFLTMDLEARGRPDLARVLEAAYGDAGGAAGPAHLMAFYAMERALVRAKVDGVRAQQLGPAAGAPIAARGADKLALAARLAWRARGPLALVVCGLSGSGKSALAAALARERGAPVIGSDRVRKELAGVAAGDRAPADAYRPEFSLRVYAELGRRAAAALAASCGPVVIDATARRAADRRALLAELAGPAVFARCVAPPEVLRERVRRRAGAGRSVSDADEAVLAAQRFEPLRELAPGDAIEVPSGGTVAAALEALERALDARLGRQPPAAGTTSTGRSA